MSGLTFVLAILASARTWRLLTIDSITFPLRTLVDRGPDWLKEAWWCPFCTGYWWSVCWVSTALAWGQHWEWKLLAGSMAVNYISGHLNKIGDISG